MDTMQRVQGAVLQTWRELFQDESAQIDDQFFAVGGDSLLAFRLKSELAKRHGLHVEMSDILKNGTPRSLAAAVLMQGTDRS